MKRTHAMAVIPLCFFAGATLANILTSEWRNNPPAYVVGSAALASPFFLLLAGHLTIAKTWRSHAVLIMSNLVVAAALYVASFAMRWFQAGWIGVLVFTLVLFCIAGICFAGAMGINNCGRPPHPPVPNSSLDPDDRGRRSK